MTLTFPDLLTIAGIAVSVLVPSALYVKRKVDVLTGNHLAHIDEKLDTLTEKVDQLSDDVKLLTGRWEGYELPERVTRLERRQFAGWENK